VVKTKLVFVLATLTFTLSGQEHADSTKIWNIRGLFNIGKNSAIFTNWAAGGESNYGGSGIVNLNINYEGEEVSLTNRLEMNFGFIKRTENPFEKTSDRLELTSIFGSKLTDKWNFNTTLNFRTQFARGFNLPNREQRISNFMSPAFLTITTGIEYKPNEKFNLIIGPTSYRATFVLDRDLANRGAFGVRPEIIDSEGNQLRPGGWFRIEFGAFFRFSYQDEILKNVNFQSSANLFNSYETKLTRFDVQFDNLFSFKISKLISVTTLISILYNEDQPVQINEQGDLSRRTQIKQTLVFGLTKTIGAGKKVNISKEVNEYVMPFQN
jgi:hypothetical protein